jgi:hypothetical protein
MAKQLCQWKPPGKTKRGRPKKSWREEMMTAMQSRGLNIEDAQDRQTALEDWHGKAAVAV